MKKHTILDSIVCLVRNGAYMQYIREWVPGLIALSILLLVYTVTLQWDISSSGHDYTRDVGEIQVALNIWGTIHYTGYPLFTVLSALLTKMGNTMGMPPAAAASAAATVWSLLGLMVAYRILCRLTRGEYGIAAAMVLVIGLVETFWIHSVVAEVYSFSLFLTTLALFISLRLTKRWNEREWWILMCVLGAGVAHHRLLALLVPWIILSLTPTLRNCCKFRLTWVLYSMIALLIPFVAYLYLPLRALQNSPWVYGQPDTWAGFWAQFLGVEETREILIIPTDLQQWLVNLRFLKEHIIHQLPYIVLLTGGVGLIWLTWRRFWVGVTLSGVAGTFLTFVVVYPSAVWAPATLMSAILMVAFGCAYFLHTIAIRWPFARYIAWVSLVVLSLIMFKENFPFVWEIRNSTGRKVVKALSPLNESHIPGENHVVALPWGGSFSAAAYGLYVTEDLSNFALIDHRADFRSVVNENGKILTLASHLGYWSLDWWSDLLGGAHYSSVAPGVVAISKVPLYRDVYGDTASQSNFDLGNGIRLCTVEMDWLTEHELWIKILWKKVKVVDANYRVGVYLVDKIPPDGAQNILAQTDAVHPVNGYYPVTVWQIGETVRDDYMLTVPTSVLTDAASLSVMIGMYKIGQDGSFINTEWFFADINDLLASNY